MKKWWRTSIAAILAVSGILIISGCNSTPDPTPSEPSTGQAGDVDSVFVQSIDSFGLTLLENLNEGASENTLISPVSIHDALSMVANGASGDTAAQLTETLGTYTYGTDNVNQQWANLLTTLNDDENASDNKNAGTLDVANALWYQKGLVPDESFLSTVGSYYGAQVQEVEFGKESAVKTINEWVASNTNDNIKEIVSKGDLSSNTVMSLTNTVYFKSNWANPFNANATKDENFTKTDGTTVSVPMMNTTESYKYFEDENAQVAKVPYSDGKTAMYIALPKEDATNESIIDNLGGDGFATVADEMGKDEAVKRVALSLPRIDTEYKTSLIGALQGMGIKNAFDPQAAEFPSLFTEMNENPIYIGSIAHAVRLVVDEEGTEASAATNVGMDTTAAHTDESPVEMRCDHPFVVILADEDTNAILFAGSILDPSK